MASAQTRSVDETVPVMIVGAGPAGLTTALALARQGIQCQISTAIGSGGGGDQGDFHAGVYESGR